MNIFTLTIECSKFTLSMFRSVSHSAFFVSEITLDLEQNLKSKHTQYVRFQTIQALYRFLGCSKGIVYAVISYRTYKVRIQILSTSFNDIISVRYLSVTFPM